MIRMMTETAITAIATKLKEIIIMITSRGNPSPFTLRMLYLFKSIFHDDL